MKRTKSSIARVLLVGVVLAGLGLSACSFTSPVVATVGGSPITREWLDSMQAAFEGDRSLQALVNIAPQVFVQSPEEAASIPGLTGNELRLALLTRRLNLEVVGTMLGRMGLDPTEWRKFAADNLQGRLADRNWASESQRSAVIDFASRWQGDRQMLLEALMPSQPDEQALRTLFEAYPTFGARLCFSVIKVQTQEDALAVEERLRSGESFSQVAADLSQDQASKTRRGDVGCVVLLEAFQRLQDPVPFLVAFSLDPGQARGPVEGATGGAWYVRRAESGSTGTDFESAREHLIQQYSQARIQYVSDRFAEVASTIDVRIACPEGRWNPEQLTIEPCVGAVPVEDTIPVPGPEQPQEGVTPSVSGQEPEGGAAR